MPQKWAIFNPIAQRNSYKNIRFQKSMLKSNFKNDIKKFGFKKFSSNFEKFRVTTETHKQIPF